MNTATLDTRTATPRKRSAATAGFTLVELLVSLGLVSLLLLMFAQVFQIATETMSTQRAIMENDQRTRALTMNLTHDFSQRTMRTVMPFRPGEQDPPNLAYYSFVNRRGFLSISENVTTNDADDVLHFTVLVPSTEEPLYGKATALTNIIANPNQPEADDFVTYANSVATSSMAEVVYFLRNGNLYRRVMLIRDPMDKSLMDRQPNDAPLGLTGGNDLFNIGPLPTGHPVYYAAGNDFWKDFDFSARFQTDSSGNPLGARFIGGGAVGVNPLDNGQGSGYFPIGIPLNRFGHNPITSHGNGSGSTSSVGNPREFVVDTSVTPNVSLFIGRFTHEETSHTDFNYPHSASAFGTIGVPTDPIDTPGTVLKDTNSNGVIDQFEQGSRRGEDLLLSNVHGFDVKVWDEVIGDYVDIGHALSNGATAGDFNQSRNQRLTYGPLTAGNRMFDTWHPHFDANNNGNDSSAFDTSTVPPTQIIDTGDNPPFLPTYSTAWAANTSYKVGDVVVPTTSNGLAYRATNIVYNRASSNTGTSGLIEPLPWPSLGKSTYDKDLPVSPNNIITWTAIPIIKRLKSLRITIRYLDVSSDQMRQLTLIQSLMD